MNKNIVSGIQIKENLIHLTLRPKCVSVGSQTVLSEGCIRTRAHFEEYEARHIWRAMDPRPPRDIQASHHQIEMPMTQRNIPSSLDTSPLSPNLPIQLASPPPGYDQSRRR